MNPAFQMNFTHRATHEQAALMSLKNLCACPDISVVKKMNWIFSVRTRDLLKLDKVGLAVSQW